MNHIVIDGTVIDIFPRNHMELKSLTDEIKHIDKELNDINNFKCEVDTRMGRILFSPMTKVETIYNEKETKLLKETFERCVEEINTLADLRIIKVKLLYQLFQTLFDPIKDNDINTPIYIREY